MNVPMTNMPQFIKREIEAIEDKLHPFMKKMSRYAFWSLPLIVISIMNLFVLLFMIPQDQRSIVSIIIYAVIGAIGFALSKEVKLQKKEVRQHSVNYIVERIQRSNIVSETVKANYINQVKQHPDRAMNQFVAFLQEENQFRS
ncbi:DUF5392 family protein [Oceanobacillus halotolerans]|uniref:DUF5392 family protein n=1 Tax=Oceanobacillus halotolerans TaxID=2663380 RepID=UPI0013D2FC79|nr:DUF5392 family protein [Oceanobacillus halotolerans]